MKPTVLAFVLAASILGGLFGGGDDIQVVSLARDGKVYVSFNLAAPISDDMKAALRSGLPISISYDVSLKRLVPVWFDSTIAAATVVTSAQYDTLTRLYQLSRGVDGRTEAPKVTGDEEVVRQWITSSGTDRLPLFTTESLEPNEVYYVQVRARARPRFNWFFFWPFDRDSATGIARFTFIPS